MFSDTIKYKDFDGNVREEVLRFNLTRAECVELEAEAPGGLQNYLNDLYEKEDKEKMFAFLQKMVKKAYGEKSQDGRYFRKSKQLLDDFVSSNVYSEVVTKLITDDNYMQTFFNAVVPRDGEMLSLA